MRSICAISIIWLIVGLASCSKEGGDEAATARVLDDSTRPPETGVPVEAPVGRPLISETGATIRENAFPLPERYPVSEVSIPGVEIGDTGFLVVYKDTAYEFRTYGNPGYPERGYDTDTIRFPIPPATEENGMKSIWVSRLTKDGEIQAYRYLMQRWNGSLRVTALLPGDPPDEYTISREGETVKVAYENGSMMYAINDRGELCVSDLDTDPAETLWIWSPRFGGVYSSSDALLEPGDGRFEGGIETPVRYVERPRDDPSGGSDLTIDFRSIDGSTWVDANGIEPVCEAQLVGLRGWLRGGDLLERYAIAKIVLRHHRGLDAALAAAVLSVAGEK